MVAAFSLGRWGGRGRTAGLVSAEGLGGAGDDLILGGLRVTAVPGGLVFDLVPAVVGSEFGWATERAAGPRPAPAALRRLPAGRGRGPGRGLVGGAEPDRGHGGGPAPGRRRHRRRDGLERPAHLAALAAALVATLLYGLLGAACALVLRGALAGVVALLAYGLLGELVLAPQWAPATGWTIHSSARPTHRPGTTSLARAALVVTLAFVLALAGCLALCARRQVRD